MTTTQKPDREATGSRPVWPEIAIIGGYPPPYGGISVHLQRLVEYLEKEGADFVLYSISGQKPPNVIAVPRRKLAAALWFVGFCLRHKSRIVHLYIANWYMRLAFGVTARWRKGKYILSIHNDSISVVLREAGSARARLTRWFLHQMDAVIACNTDIQRECVEMVGLPPEKVHLIPAFIPPDTENASPLPVYVRDFMKARGPLLSAVWWVGRGCTSSEETYGIDMMTELVSRMGRDFPNIGLVLSVSEHEKGLVHRTMERSRRRAGDSMLFVTEELDDIGGIMQGSDLFLRPTNTDGDAVSVREALWVGTPVVASDAVPRPESCVIFRTREMDDFEVKVRSALSDLPALRKRVRAYPMTNNAKAITEIYKRLKQ